MRFLEVFDWAPWQRYLDYWQDIHTHFKTMTAAVAAEAVEREASMIIQHSASDEELGPLEDTQALLAAHYIAIYRRGMSKPFRFSYHTILDWFVENPKANTIVLHPDVNLPCRTASLLPRWTTLCFDQTLPSSYCAEDPQETRDLASPHPLCRSPDYYSLYNPIDLLQSLIEHEQRGSVKHKGKRVGGIRHLQLPSEFYYNTDELATQVSTLVQVVQRPRSLDVSAYPDWVYMSYDIPDDNLKDLVRFISMGRQQAYLSQQGFLRRCPNLKEIEIILRNANEIDIGPDTSQMCNLSEDAMAIQGPPTTQALEVARLYAQASTELHLILMTIERSFSHSLRELKIALLPPQHQSSEEATPLRFEIKFALSRRLFVMPRLESLYLHLNSYISLQGPSPFEGCPHLQRLTLVSNGIVPVRKWRVPQSLRELVLEGYGIIEMFDMSCLEGLPRLESLSLLDNRCLDNMGLGSSSTLFWPTGTSLTLLKNLKLSGMAARSFEFGWLASVPALEALEVAGLDYNSILNAGMDGLAIVDDSYQSNDSGAPRGPRGPRVCKFTIVNKKCFNNSLATDKNLLKVLERFCPEIQRLHVNFRTCTCFSSQQMVTTSFAGEPSPSNRHLELECGTLTRLRKYLPKMTHFATESFTMRQDLLREHGFIPREHFKIADKLQMQSLFQWVECVFRLGEIEYVHAAHD
ncbi:hypothetical protein BGZ58_004019 [Dissophora ornata]|nr:hypothetical protein BGZ58_004019 [Dissophora ornata]